MSIYRKEFVEHRRLSLDFGEPLYDIPKLWAWVSVLLATLLILAIFFGLNLRLPAIVNVTGVANSTQPVADVLSPKAGFVQEIHYDDEAFVEAGSPIVTIFTGGSLSEGSDAKEVNLAQLQIEKSLYEDELSILLQKRDFQETSLRTRTAELLNEKAEAEAKKSLIEDRLKSAMFRLEEAEFDLSEGLIAKNSVYTARDLVGSQELLLLEMKSELTDINVSMEQLNRDHISQLSDLDLRRVTVEQKVAQIDQRLAESQADKVFAVTAQNSGRLGLMSIKKGEPITKDQPLFRVVTPYNTMSVSFGIPSELAKDISIGHIVEVSISTFTQSANSERYRAEITRIADVATVDPVTGDASAFQAEAIIDIVPVHLDLAAPQLRDGMKLDVKIQGPKLTLWEMATNSH